MTITPTDALRSLMQTAQIHSYQALATKAGVSRRQIQQLRTGNGHKMRLSALTQLANALEVSLIDLIQTFQLCANDSSNQRQTEQHADTLTSQSTDERISALQTDALQTIETWLVQWPTIAKRAVEKGDALSAAKILPFLRPVEALMREWDVQPIATIDSQIPYDPQYHQLTQGNANPGDLVHVTHAGQTHRCKLLHRAKVKPMG